MEKPSLRNIISTCWKALAELHAGKVSILPSLSHWHDRLSILLGSPLKYHPKRKVFHSALWSVQSPVAVAYQMLQEVPGQKTWCPLDGGHHNMPQEHSSSAAWELSRHADLHPTIFCGNPTKQIQGDSQQKGGEDSVCTANKQLEPLMSSASTAAGP